MKICFHQFLYKVDLLEIVKARRLKYIDDCNNIFVMEVTKEFNFAESPKTEHRVIKGSYTLDCNLALGWDVYGRTVCRISD